VKVRVFPEFALEPALYQHAQQTDHYNQYKGTSHCFFFFSVTFTKISKSVQIFSMSDSPSKLLLIYTGGTIGMIKDYETNALKAFDFENIKERIPELQLVDCQLDTVSFEKPIDSSDMTPDLWRRIAEIIESRYADHDGFVVLTGTDTMSYTASALSFMLEYLRKPVIFTGSQLPIGDLRTDAKENLITAIQVASAQEKGVPKVQEVALYFEYKLYRANRTTKVSSEQFEAFESPNFPNLAESGVHLTFNDPILRRLKPDEKGKELVVRKEMSSDVVILKLFPGITETTVRHVLSIPGLKGVVLETFGAGNAPTENWFLDCLSEAIQAGIQIVNVTQCVSGSVLQGLYAASSGMKRIGVLSGRDITTESALAKLRYLLTFDFSREEFKTHFERPLRGELSEF
jgi:L-asparaginase